MITGRDLYLPTASNTNDYFVRGLANQREACSTDKNCLVIEGSLVHVVPILMAHELGHSMGLTHDDMIEQNDTVSFIQICWNFFVIFAELIKITLINFIEKFYFY